MGEPQREVSEIAASTVGRRWTFGPAVLDERSLELRVNGELARIERKPLEVLIYLLHHAGEVVTKDELAEALWPGRILTETVLTRCISILRHTLHDDAKALIKTVHRFGYRLVCEVKVEASQTPSPPAFDFKPGDHPPQRPQWKLADRLGRGGHGEVWLARHEKTGEPRVFKFALDEHALVSLKREITLFRLLQDTLGKNAPVVRILEWNVSEPPYFLEEEYVTGGNLRTYAEAQGGVAMIPLADRLEFVAQVADALAAAHSVGVLHKDLKPGNVLIDSSRGAPTVRLCDFGSGAVLDPARLEALGITRRGFTKTQADAPAGATPIYLAPEVIAGQPFTVQADIYALGVMLFQVVVGDLQKPLAPGWELELEDELLREDVALAAAGNPARRLADAAQLAERLRILEARRKARAEQVAAAARSERARRAVAELRRTRVFAAVLCILASLSIGAGITAYRARDEAIAATVTARAITDFLMEDFLAADPSIDRPKDVSYQFLLDRAAERVDGRLKSQPAAAAGVHWLLGRRHYDLGQVDKAIEQYEAAARFSPVLEGRSVEPALFALATLIPIYSDRGRSTEALVLADELQSRWLTLHGQKSLATFALRIGIAKTLFETGAAERAEQELRAILRDLPAADPPTEEAIRATQNVFVTGSVANLPSDPTDAVKQLLTASANAILGAVLLEYSDENRESISRLREALATCSKVLGEYNELTARARLSLGWGLLSVGGYAEAEALIRASANFFDGWLPADHWFHSVPRIMLGRLRLEQRRPAEALELLVEAVTSRGLNDRSPKTAEDARYAIGIAYHDLGRHEEAIKSLRSSLAAFEALRGKGDLGSVRRRVSLASALREVGLLSEAATTLAALDPRVLEKLKPVVAAEVLRVQASILVDRNNTKSAESSMREAVRILSDRLGAKHWRTEGARAELAEAQRRAAIQASNSSAGSAGVKK